MSDLLWPVCVAVFGTALVFWALWWLVKPSPQFAYNETNQHLPAYEMNGRVASCMFFGIAFFLSSLGGMMLMFNVTQL